VPAPVAAVQCAEEAELKLGLAPIRFKSHSKVKCMGVAFLQHRLKSSFLRNLEHRYASSTLRLAVSSGQGVW